MASVELATAYVTLAVSTQKAAKQIGGMFRGADRHATTAGRSMGKAMQNAFNASKPLDVSRASKNLEDAQARLSLATERSAAKQKKAQEDVAAARQRVADVATRSGERVEAAAGKVSDAERGVARASEAAATDQEAAKRKVEIAQAKYNEVLRDHAPESAKALAAADGLKRAEENLERVTTRGADAQERAKRKLADAQDEYARAVAESGQDSEAARRAADDLVLAEQKLDAAAREAADEHARLSAEVDEAKRSLESAERASGGLSRAWGKVKDFGADYKGMGQRLNRAIGPKIWAGVKWGAIGAATAIGGTLVGSLKKGWDRLTGIENAEAKLTGLGHSGEDVSLIMEDALAAVKGTAFGMDEAATTAAAAVAAGIEPGKELESYLGLVGDAASIAGTSMEDMGGIFNKVATSGKVQGDVFQQLGDAGIPIVQMLAEEMGITADEVYALGSAGEIGTEEFLGAMSSMEGAALESGNTTQGAIKNTGAAMSRFGASLLSGVYPAVAPLMGRITAMFDYLTDKAGPIIEDLTADFQAWADSPQVQAFLEGVRDVAVALYENALKPLGEWLGKHWKPIAAAIGGLVAYFGGAMLVAAIGAIAGAIGSLSIPITAVGAAIAAVVGALVYFFTQTEIGQRIVSRAWEGIKRAVAVVADFFVNTVWPALVTGWDVLKAVVTAVWGGVIKPIFMAIADLAVQVWEGIVVPALQKFGGYVRDTLAPILVRLWTDYAQPAFKAIGALAVWLWENAIKPAVSAITSFWTNVLGPVMVWLWQKVVFPIFGLIGDFIAGTVTGVIFPILDALGWAFTNIVAPVVMWLWEKVFRPAWDGIKIVVAQTVVWVVNTAVPWLKQAWDAIAAAATWLYEKIIQPVWTAIKVAIAIAVTAISVAMDLLVWTWRNLVAPVMRWLYEKVVLPVWNAIKSAISAVVSWFRDVAWPILKVVIDWLSDYFVAYKLTLQLVWRLVKAAISAVVVWFRDTAWPILKNVVNWISDAFTAMRKRLSDIWSAIRSRIINPVVTWLRDTAWAGIIRPTLDKIKTGFNKMRDSLKAAWRFVKNNVINPVATWFRDTIKPLFDTVTGGIADAFDTLKDAVKEAWNGIRDTAKAPVRFLVETIIRDGIIKKYNEVANGVFGLDKINEDKFTISGWHTGGYTGPGAKYKPAGIVHADEYVIRKESQNDLRRNAPGLLDDLNRYGSRALGYASGGLVKLRMPFNGSYPRGEGFGARGGRHKGIDWPMPHGASLVAVADGTANQTRNPAAGNKLELRLGNGLTAGYHHLSRFGIAQGARATAGQTVGYVGSTGRSSGPHLHFSLKKDGSYVNPMPYLGAGGAAGSGDDGGGWWNPFEGLWDSLKSKVREGVGGSHFGDMLFELPKKVISGAVDWATEKLSAIGDWAVETGKEVAGTAGVTARWGLLGTRALTMTGDYGPMVHASMMRRINQESGGNPRAINNWDSNARRGTPSKGLMQVIQPTFDAYRDSRAPNDIWDPLANMLASIHYTKARYSSLRAGWDRPGGYADGGLVKPFLHDKGGWHNPGQLSVNKTRKPEAVLTNAQWDTMHSLAEQNLASAGGGVTINGGVHGLDEAEVVRRLKVRERRERALYGRV